MSKSSRKLIDCLLILVVVAIMYSLNIPCLFLSVFNIPCAGCGITRSYLSLLDLDITKAFEHNPMFWAVPIIGLMYIFDSKLTKLKRLTSIVLISIYLGFFIFWVIKIICYRNLRF